MDSSDVVIQVLDARDPQGTRCRFLEQHLRKNARHKHLLLLLNKCDLVSLGGGGGLPRQPGDRDPQGGGGPTSVCALCMLPTRPSCVAACATAGPASHPAPCRMVPACNVPCVRAPGLVMSNVFVRTIRLSLTMNNTVESR